MNKPTDIVKDHLAVMASWKRVIYRGNGDIETLERHNTMQYTGLNQAAKLLISNADSAFLYIAIGTETDQASLGSTDFGEVSRKLASTNASSDNTAILVATWAGNADGLTGVALGSGAGVNHADSAQGQILNIVNSLDATLQDSDTMSVEVRVQVGSHNL